jgi:hypothetical protein
VVAANKVAAANRSLVSSSSSLVSSSRDRSPDRAANKAASRNKVPLQRKEPLVSAGGFYLLDPSPIERSRQPETQPFMAWRGGNRPFDKGHPRSLPPFEVVIIASPKRLFLCTRLAAGAMCRGGGI